MPIIGTIGGGGAYGRLGLNLTQRTLPVTYSLSTYQKGSNGNVWLVGSSGSTSIAYSSNGTTWTTSTINVGLKSHLGGDYNSAGPQGRFVTADGNTTVSYSITGIGSTWSSASANYSGSLASFRYTPVTGYIKKYSDSSLESSPNGSSWTIRTGALYGAYDIAYSNTITLFPAYGQDKVNYTTNATWATISQANLPSSKYWIGAAYDSVNNRFIVYDDSGNLAYSSNGTTWTQISIPTLNGYSYAASNDGGGGAFVLGGSGGYLFSKNGTTWTKQNLPSGTYYAKWDSTNNIFLLMTGSSTTYYTGTIPS